jgi:hypothetical protein
LILQISLILGSLWKRVLIPLNQLVTCLRWSLHSQPNNWTTKLQVINLHSQRIKSNLNQPKEEEAVVAEDVAEDVEEDSEAEAEASEVDSEVDSEVRKILKSAVVEAEEEEDVVEEVQEDPQEHVVEEEVVEEEDRLLLASIVAAVVEEEAATVEKVDRVVLNRNSNVPLKDLRFSASSSLWIL